MRELVFCLVEDRVVREEQVELHAAHCEERGIREEGGEPVGLPVNVTGSIRPSPPAGARALGSSGAAERNPTSDSSASRNGAGYASASIPVRRKPSPTECRVAAHELRPASVRAVVAADR